MERIILSQESETYTLVQEDEGLRLVVLDGKAEAPIVDFPIQKSLLRAVLSGFSYQIANENGTLQISSQDDLVVISVHTLSKRKLQTKIENRVFSRDLDAFVQ